MAENRYKSWLSIHSHPRGRGFESLQVHQKRARRTLSVGLAHVRLGPLLLRQKGYGALTLQRVGVHVQRHEDKGYLSATKNGQLPIIWELPEKFIGLTGLALYSSSLSMMSQRAEFGSGFGSNSGSP